MNSKENKLTNKNFIIEMKDKDLDFTWPVTNAIYSTDLLKRFVILKEMDHMYSYRLQFLMLIDDESDYYGWNEPCCSMSHSIFYNEEDAINDIKMTDEFKKYFNFE